MDSTPMADREMGLGMEGVALVHHCPSSVSWGRDHPQNYSRPLDVAYDVTSRRALYAMI
jgi:hypothetical protein